MYSVLSRRQKSHHGVLILFLAASDMQQDIWYKIEARMHSIILYCTTVCPRYAPSQRDLLDNSKVGASDDVKITVSSFIIVCAIEQYNNNNDQARIIVATRLLCTSYWVHLLNATLPPICMIYSHVKNDLNIQLHEQPVRRIPPIILLHHHFININGFVHTYESVMHICPISIESIGW